MSGWVSSAMSAQGRTIMTSKTQTLPRPCGATRPPLRDPGWECTGRDLIIVTTTKVTGELLPVVLPARALEIHEPEDGWDTPVRPFTGGDHLHLCVPRRPTSFRGDTVMHEGDAAVLWKYLGPVAGGGHAWMGPPPEGS
jgi:hypothetical protein